MVHGQIPEAVKELVLGTAALLDKQFQLFRVDSLKLSSLVTSPRR
jgi:hypothetical protein